MVLGVVALGVNWAFCVWNLEVEQLAMGKSDVEGATSNA